MLSFSRAGAAAIQCSVYFTEARADGTRTAPLLNSNSYTEVLDFKAKVENAKGELVGSTLKEALGKSEVQDLIRNNRRAYEILLTAKLPVRDGAGTLRLVVLNESSGNRAYNHVELTALLRVNPELANELGFYRVDGEHSLVWVPDVKTINYRLKKLAQKFGYKNGIWGYSAADGVVDTMPYLKLLKTGKFPFSGMADVNLSVHDAMHSVAFAVLNVTAGGRKILEAAKSRNKIVLKIYERLKTEFASFYADKFINNIATHLSSDSMERTMLLTIVLTGNYDYFSVLKVRANNSGLYFTKQNKETTLNRITQLLRLFNSSHKTFEQALNQLVPEGDPNREKIKAIFIKEISVLKSATPAEIRSAAEQIIKFIPDDVFATTVDAGSILNSKIENHEAAGPETLTETLAGSFD